MAWHWTGDMPLSGPISPTHIYIAWPQSVQPSDIQNICTLEYLERYLLDYMSPKGNYNIPGSPCWWANNKAKPISMNISSYAYNALRLTAEILFWAMPFASFQTDVNKCFAIVFPRCQVMYNCDVMSPWVTWQNNRLMISRFVILSREYLLQTALCKQ